MKLVVQRVKKSKVTVEDKVIGSINEGFLVLIGISNNDTKENADYLVKKLINLRVFSDNDGKMNLSIKEYKRRITFSITVYIVCRL